MNRWRAVVHVQVVLAAVAVLVVATVAVTLVVVVVEVAVVHVAIYVVVVPTVVLVVAATLVPMIVILVVILDAVVVVVDAFLAVGHVRVVAQVAAAHVQEAVLDAVTLVPEDAQAVRIAMVSAVDVTVVQAAVIHAAPAPELVQDAAVVQAHVRMAVSDVLLHVRIAVAHVQDVMQDVKMAVKTVVQVNVHRIAIQHVLHRLLVQS